MELFLGLPIQDVQSTLYALTLPTQGPNAAKLQ